MSLPTQVRVITGTDTDVGKTHATAHIAARWLAAGHSVHVDKPVQTGVADGADGAETDVQTVRRLLGAPTALTCTEGVRLEPAMAPVDAARLTGSRLPDLSWQLARLERVVSGDVLLIEGAGGISVEICSGTDMADLARELSAPLDVVVRPGLGTQNHTLLTLEYAVRRQVRLGALIVCRVPAEPDPVVQANLTHLRALADRFDMAWGPHVAERTPNPS